MFSWLGGIAPGRPPGETAGNAKPGRDLAAIGSSGVTRRRAGDGLAAGTTRPVVQCGTLRPVPRPAGGPSAARCASATEILCRSQRPLDTLDRAPVVAFDFNPDVTRRVAESAYAFRDWFKALYETLLGSEQGPRMGSFFALYGIDNSRRLIAEALGENAA